MRIICPNCDAEYDVPPTLIGDGRRVRCARCGQLWEAHPAEAAAPVSAEAEAGPAPLQPGWSASYTSPVPEPALAEPAPQWSEPPPVPKLVAVDPPDAPRAPIGAASRVVMMGWALSLAVLLLAGVLVVQRRDAVMAAWPASTRAYAAFGLAPGAAGRSLNAGNAASR